MNKKLKLTKDSWKDYPDNFIYSIMDEYRDTEFYSNFNFFELSCNISKLNSLDNFSTVNSELIEVCEMESTLNQLLQMYKVELNSISNILNTFEENKEKLIQLKLLLTKEINLVKKRIIDIL